MSSAVGETSAGKRSSQSNASAVGNKSSLEHKVVGGGGSEKLINACVKSSSVNLEDINNNNNNVEHNNCMNNVRKRRKLNKTYAHLIHDTIINLKARKGSSSNAISKNIEKLHGSSLGPNYKKVVGHTLKKLTVEGKLIRTGHSFKLAPNFRGEFDMNLFDQQQEQTTAHDKDSKEKSERRMTHRGCKSKGQRRAYIRTKRYRKQQMRAGRRRRTCKRSTGRYKYYLLGSGSGLCKRRRPRVVMCPLAMRRHACGYRYSRRRRRSRCRSSSKKKAHCRKEKSTSPGHSSATSGDSSCSSCQQSVASSKSAKSEGSGGSPGSRGSRWC